MRANVENDDYFINKEVRNYTTSLIAIKVA